MNTFVSSLEKTAKKAALKTRTENGAKTFSTSTNKNVDLFFKIGALRGQPADKVVGVFREAFAENSELATRILLWARDVRQGAGERKVFRDVFQWLEINDRDLFTRVAKRVGELGRWDDLLVAQSESGKKLAFELIRDALDDGNGLAAKWMPRKGPLAVELRKFIGLTPKQYRKRLVELTTVVETAMCAKDYTSVNYEHVPSLAMSRYTKAFKKNDLARFTEFLGDVVKGEKKINAGAVYPYDVLKPLFENSYYYYNSFGPRVDSVERARINSQWDALPNYLGDQAIIPMIDVSGSMASSCGGTLKCIHVSTSLGLYLGTKNSGAFKDVVMTFDSNPELLKLGGDTVDKYAQIYKGAGTSTNLSKAFTKLLIHAIQHDVPQQDMPKYVLILSDMEFDSPYGGDVTLSKDVERQYKNSGYEMPVVVWWNIQSRNDNSPVKAGKQGQILVSGFSPAIAKAVLSMDVENMTPLNTMLKVILNDRYNF
jgi:hypothetical protein